MTLRRALGTRDVTLFAIACIIGTRWIPTAAHAGPGSILLWILGALCFAIPLAVAVAALTVRHSEAGGMYIWTRHDFGPFAGFLCFWLYWMGIVIWFPGAAMFYVSAMGLPALHDRTWLVVVALAAIWIGLIANIFGVESGQRIADAGAASSWTLALLFIAAAFVFLRHHHAATPFHMLPDPSWDTVSFWAAIAYALSGLELVGMMGAEIRDPKRSIVRAAWVSSLVSVTFYSAATAAVLVLLPAGKISELDGLAQAGKATAAALGFSWLAPVVALLVLGSAIGQFGGIGSSVSRLPFAAGVDGLLPAAFGRTHPRWKTPHISMLTLGALASLLLIAMQVGDTARAAYDTIVSLMVIVGFLPFLWMFGSAWKEGHRLAAAMGGGVTLIAIVAGVIPPGGVTHIWIFEGKLALGTIGTIGAGWLIYRVQSSHLS
jgi:amino acid transporter